MTKKPVKKAAAKKTVVTQAKYAAVSKDIQQQVAEARELQHKLLESAMEKVLLKSVANIEAKAKTAEWIKESKFTESVKSEQATKAPMPQDKQATTVDNVITNLRQKNGYMVDLLIRITNTIRNVSGNAIGIPYEKESDTDMTKLDTMWNAMEHYNNLVETLASCTTHIEQLL